MSSLKDVKTRKETVSTIRKITKAMELVATSKIKQAKKNLNKIQKYALRVEAVFQNIHYKISNWDEIFKINESKPKVYIVITSDIGMCGSYNANIVKLAKKIVSENDHLIVLGSKGYKLLKKFFKKEQFISKFDNVGENVDYEIIEKIINQITPLLMNGKISQISLLETEFINSITFSAIEKIIFPLTKDSKLKEDDISKNVEFEPDPETIIKKAIPLYFGAIIFTSIASSKLSEASSRRMAMENASDNALDIINNLEKQYNKIRQSKITQEITEIVSGAQND